MSTSTRPATRPCLGPTLGGREPGPRPCARRGPPWAPGRAVLGVVRRQPRHHRHRLRGHNRLAGARPLAGDGRCHRRVGSFVPSRRRARSSGQASGLAYARAVAASLRALRQHRAGHRQLGEPRRLGNRDGRHRRRRLGGTGRKGAGPAGVGHAGVRGPSGGGVGIPCPRAPGARHHRRRPAHRRLDLRPAHARDLPRTGPAGTLVWPWCTPTPARTWRF